MFSWIKSKMLIWISFFLLIMYINIACLKQFVFNKAREKTSGRVSNKKDVSLEKGKRFFNFKILKNYVYHDKNQIK